MMRLAHDSIVTNDVLNQLSYLSEFLQFIKFYVQIN